MKLSFEDWWEVNYVNAKDDFGKLKYRTAYLITAGPVAKRAWDAALAQQAQPEMPTRGEIAMTLASIDYPKLEWEQVASCAAEIYLLQADAVLALFAPKEPE